MTDLPDPDDRLDSWKEIAQFLGRTVRTVQRWEKTDGLPVCRGGPGHRGAVVASKRQLRAWWERRADALADASSSREGTDASPPSPPVKDAELPISPIPPGLSSVGAAAGTLIAAAIALAAVFGWIWRETTTATVASQLGRLLAESTSENRRLRSIPLGASPAGLQIADDDRMAYVGFHERGTVGVVDLRAAKVIAEIEAVSGVYILRLSPDGDHLYVGGSSELGIIDLHDRTVRRIAVSGMIHGLQLAREGREVWIAMARGGLKVFDIQSGAFSTVPTIGCPMQFARAPRHHRVFLSYQCGGPGGRDGHDALEIIDERSRTPIAAEAGLPMVGSALALSPDEQHLWAGTHDACAIDDYDHAGCPPGEGPLFHAFRASNLEHLFSIRLPTEGFTASPLFFPDGSRVAVSSVGLFVVDRALGTVKEAAMLGRLGAGAFSADGRHFYVLSDTGHTLYDLRIGAPMDPSVSVGLGTHWSGDGTANDIVGGTHARAGEPRFAPGRLGQAFVFDGTSNALDFGRRLEVDITSGPATYAAWIRPRHGAGVAMRLISRSGLAGWEWGLSDDGRLEFCLAQVQDRLSCRNAWLFGATALPADVWSHVAVVRDARTITLFVNGRPDGSARVGALQSDVDIATTRLTLGAAHDGSAPFAGLVDEVTFFRRALSASEIGGLMRELQARSADGRR